MLGGDHGRLKYGPPIGHSPVFESLLPKEKLKIEPCFHCGDTPKNIYAGPTEVEEHSAFVPNPVDTAHVSTNAKFVFMFNFSLHYNSGNTLI